MELAPSVKLKPPVELPKTIALYIKSLAEAIAERA